MPGASRKRERVGSAVLIGLLATIPALAASSSADLVPIRSAARLQSIATLTAGGPASSPCLTPTLQVIRSERQRGTAVNRRALTALASDPTLPGERVAVDADGNTVRFTVERTAADRVEATDDNGNGLPDAVDEVLSGASRAQRLLIGQLELPSPGTLEIVLSRLGSNVEGVSIPLSGRPARNHVWLDSSAVRTAPASLRRAAEHQYAHAVAAAVGLDPAWGEAFATWTVLALESIPDDRTVAVLAGRLAAANTGLVTQDLDLAGGNAAWFAFLNDAYGPTAVKLAIEELGRGGSDQAALDSAMRRATGSSLDAALRDFQVWTLLVGPRDDGKHFTFASRLPAPAFAASAEAFPALSVQAEPEVGPMGHAAVLLRPDELGGGLTIRFEGDPSARWAVDLLLVHPNGALRRVPVVLDADDASELSVPVQDVREVLLLVRNLDPEGRPARRYSWAAQFEPGFPAEFGALRAEPTSRGAGTLVSWETVTERGLLGFNVLRSRLDRGAAVRVNPVWIPSVGESSGPAAYSFFDAGAEAGVAYRYEIEAVTLEGLASRSEAIPLAPTPY
jgi:hypothetical protein